MKRGTIFLLIVVACIGVELGRLSGDHSCAADTLSLRPLGSFGLSPSQGLFFPFVGLG